MALHEVSVTPITIDRFVPLVGAGPVAHVRALFRQFGERTIWSVNSTAMGGGVAEMLRQLVAYGRGEGLDARWIVIEGPAEFFRLTKRLHNALHGEPGDGSPLGPSERALYEQVCGEAARELIGLVRPGDVVVLHDPQTAGLAPALVDAGARVVWRSHVGSDAPNEETRRAWRFVLPYVEGVQLRIFSRRAYVPPGLDRTAVVTPSIDPFSVKNRAIEGTDACEILEHAGLLRCSRELRAPGFTRADGTHARLEHAVDVMGLGALPHADEPLVVQVSRWDTLKDPVGVLEGFARCVASNRHCGAHLVLAGPNVHAVADDPDGARVYEEVVHAFRKLPHDVRMRVLVAMLPMHDVDENALLVNALQTHATVVVQKSLQEGFGLTVAEALWKARPVVASAVGGIQDQITDGENGLLLADPRDPEAFAAALHRLLADPAMRVRIGRAGRETVRERFLTIRHMEVLGELLVSIGKA